MLDAMDLEVTKQEWNLSLQNRTNVKNMEKNETTNENLKWMDFPWNSLCVYLGLLRMVL
jgi:hypothetical protein